jgi:NAD(P)H-flavin reductase
MSSNNPYIPSRATIMQVIQETTSDTQDVKTYRLKLDEPFDYRPGQFVEFSVAGVGECTFGFASSPLMKDYLELTIKRTGYVTENIHMLSEGSTVWIRGPFGNTFPLEKLEGNDLFYVAGGLGLAPLRPMIDYIFDPRIAESTERSTCSWRRERPETIFSPMISINGPICRTPNSISPSTIRWTDGTNMSASRTP